MAVLTYSRRLDGDRQLTVNFKVSEFACTDGSDQILICESLVKVLQWIRDHFKASVTITSAYRTATRNKEVGGASNSQHLYGMAADISVAGVDPLAVAQYAENVMVKGGIGYYPSGEGYFTHIDTRQVKSRWKQQNGKTVSVSGFGGTVAVATPEETAPITIDIEAKAFDIAGQTRIMRAGLVDGENYIHARDIATFTGWDVAYDDKTRRISFDPPELNLYVDGIKQNISGLIAAGNTFVQLRDFAAITGAAVSYNETEKRIDVTLK